LACSDVHQNPDQIEEKMFKLLLCLAAGALASRADTIYDLASSFSTTSNPNGVWSFIQGDIDLPYQTQPTDANSLNPAAANGYFGVANTFAVGPFILEASQNGAATSPFTNNDFESGDILAESTNPGAGLPLFIEWTAPVAGTITFSGDVWYAHSPVDRSQNYAVLLDFGAPLATGTVAWNSGNGRSNPSTFSSSGPLTVAAGDVLALELAPTAGQMFGSLSGVNLTVDLTASTQTPEPGTNLLLAGGLLCIVTALKRSRTA
jgi:hypothetical protein